MIVFDLLCDDGHRFEGWFASSGEFARQQTEGLVSCPSCGGREVVRVPSATRMNTRTPDRARRADCDDSMVSEAEPGKPNPSRIAHALYSRFVDEVLRKTEDVGADFPQEARRIHYEESVRRPIRGTATQEEHDALLDEGVPVARFPIPPEGRLN